MMRIVISWAKMEGQNSEDGNSANVRWVVSEEDDLDTRLDEEAKSESKVQTLLQSNAVLGCAPTGKMDFNGRTIGLHFSNVL